MDNKKRLIDANSLKYERVLQKVSLNVINAVPYYEIEEAATVAAIPVSDIKAYLQAKLDEWNSLGDRKWEPANMWGYNFVMACFDDLQRRTEQLGGDSR